MSQAPLLRMVNITKSYSGIHALKDVDLTVNHAEVLGLVGDNGAGKTTLVKILVGLIPPDNGECYFEGRKVSFKSPIDARKAGIEAVYQEMALINTLSVCRNFFLARELFKKRGFIKWLDLEKMREISLISKKSVCM